MPKPTMAGAITSAYDETNGGLDVNPQSSTLPLFQYFLMDERKRDITLTAPIAIDDEVVNVSAVHGFVGQGADPGECIVVRSGDFFFQMLTTTIAVNEIGVEMPIDMVFPDTAEVIRGNIFLNKDGSSADIHYKFSTDKNGGIKPVVPIDLAGVSVTMQHASAADDSTFGGIAEIAKGFYFRKVNGLITNLGNYTTNQKFRDLGAEVIYTAKAGGGAFATNIYFDLKKVFTQEVRLDPDYPDEVDGVVRDALQTLLKFTVSLLGSLTSGE